MFHIINIKKNIIGEGELMKGTNKEVAMVASFKSTECNAEVRPIKFKLLKKGYDEPIVIKEDKIVNKTTTKITGILVYIFTYQSVIRGVERIYELRYDTKNTKRFLFKI